MSLANRLAALLSSLTDNQLAAMSPVERAQLINQCQRVLGKATIAQHQAEATALERREPLKQSVRSGVLPELAKGKRSE